jgi:hypothetical protein
VLLTAHDVVAWIVVVGNGVAGAWALAAHGVEPLRVRALWWVTGVAEVAIFVQAGIGVALLNQADYVDPGFHLFYGVLAIIAVGIIYSYRPQLQPWRYLLYGFGGLFIMGLGIRAMTLGVELAG